MKRTRPPVVVTGLGACTSLGATLDATWAALATGRSGITATLPASLPPGIGRVAAAAAEADRPPSLRTAKHAKYAGRAVTLALHALAEATAAVDLGDLDPLRVAVHGATGQTGLDVEEFFPALAAAWADDPSHDFAAVGGRASRLVDPHFSLRTLGNGGLALVAAELGARGSSTNYVQSEMASAYALRAALNDLRDGRCDAAVVFACDSWLQPSQWLACQAEGLLSEAWPEPALRPFDRARDGLVPGEAGAVAVLETSSRAEARGATTLGFIDEVDLGYSPAAAGTASAVGLAAALDLARERGEWAHVADAGSGDPTLVMVARGLGTREHDREELHALADARVGGAVVTAFKGATGYVGAATGVLELALALRALQARMAPPIVGLREPDSCNEVPLLLSPRGLGSGARALLATAGWSGDWAITAVRR